MATTTTQPNIPSMFMLLGLALLAAATLTFEINLTRLYSVAQFYHFAFLIVSMALLGFGASGTFLAIKSHFGHENPRLRLTWLCLAAGLSMMIAYLLTNWLPFDSFSITWDMRQALILSLHYLWLSTPFFFSGLATGMLLSRYPNSAPTTYGVNLLGSAAGCVIALIAPASLGGEGVVTLCFAMTLIATLVCYPITSINPRSTPMRLMQIIICILLLITIFTLVDRTIRVKPRRWMELQLSPYKGLSYALQYPNAQVIFQRWNAISRVDMVRSVGVRSLPGLSYRYNHPPPPEDGLFIDGDELSAVLRPGYATDFFNYLPGSIAYKLNPGGKVLVLEPRGGLDVLTAIQLGAKDITAVEANPLVIQAAEHIYNHPDLETYTESNRSFLRRSTDQFDTIVLSLANNYHPVRSGAYSLAEDYRYTIESFEDAIDRLSPSGVLVVTRWLQNPPSESIRAFSLAVEALENKGGEPREQIVAFRGYNTITLLIQNRAFNTEQLATIKAWIDENAFDLVFAPGMQPEEANQNNILPEPIYYQAFIDLLNSQPREDFYNSYPYEIQPPTDDRPFFGHYFKWSQTQQILAEFGKTWQPFGGAGYFIVLALLILALVMAGLLILAPVAIASLGRSKTTLKSSQIDRQTIPYLMYFALIGFGFLLAEIPLIQRFILFLGYPAYALTAVLFTILLFSGLGSLTSARLSLTSSLAILVVILIFGPYLLPLVFQRALGTPLWARLTLTVVMLAPLGLLMGIPFPGGIRWMIGRGNLSELIPWIWAINGATSVVAAVLAALLALSLGFTWVLWIGAVCYAACWLIVLATTRNVRSPHP